MNKCVFFMILDKEMHIFEHKSKLSVLLIWLFLVFFCVGKGNDIQVDPNSLSNASPEGAT